MKSPFCRSLHVVLVAGLLAFVGPARAEKEQKPADWYQVELIVFEQGTLRDATTETWPEQPPLPTVDTALELREQPLAGKRPVSPAEPEVRAPQPFRLLPEKALQLNSAARSVRLSSRLEPIMHIGWRQQIPEKAQARAIHLHGGERYIEGIPGADPGAMNAPADRVPGPLGVQRRSTIEASDESLVLEGPQPLENAIDAQVIEQLDGTILLTRARYLHIWTDLLYAVPAQAYPDSQLQDYGSNLIRFPMRAHRRMRSGELHYLDHPLFGILVLITPYEPPEPEATETEEQPPEAAPSAPPA